MDIRTYFQRGERELNIARPNRKKRLYELPMKSPYEGYFEKGQPKPAEELMVQTRPKKRVKVEAINPIQKIPSKLSILQWHFSQPSPNCVVTAKRFFPNEPVKLRSVQN